MPTNDYGKINLALLLGSSGTVPEYCAIGSGSGTFTSSQSGLNNEMLGSRITFTTRDLSTSKKVDYVFNYSSTTMSGLTLSEFGIGGSEAVGVGDLSNIETLGSITFDGTNELEVQIIYEIF